ncbi:MAG TPA: sigma-70 family RNA polymerase sigma factor [Planctomycetaceae bacterium]|nr:sigma-70 family RNA polymerase sigma factor [Planctomycetaceae bacterium]
MNAAVPNEPDHARGRPPIDWPAMLREHHRWLRTVVRARTGCADGADDVLQEVALAAVKQQAPLADSSRVAPWLYRLAVRQALLYRRRLGRERRLKERYRDRNGRPHDGERSSDPLDWLIADERRALIRTALAQLPPRDAEILLLKYTENWTYHELADRLGISHSAVEARLYRARERFRQRLAALNVIEAMR